VVFLCAVFAQLTARLAQHRPAAVQCQRRHQAGHRQVGPSRAGAEHTERGHEHRHVADGVVARAQPHAAHVGVTLCYSALFKANRHDQILELLAMDPRPIWPYLVWGAKVLATRGRIDEAIAYLRERAGSTTSETSIARFAEEELLKAGRRAEAFNQYALLANQANTHIATFRAVAKKYPELAKDNLLNHLIASTPGEPGKWFATAKTLKLYEQATRLAWASPCDPKTLNRAARDHLKTQPDFAMQCALASLHWMSMGHGFELTGLDVLEAHRFAIEAAAVTQQARTSIEQVLASDGPMVAWMQRSLGTVR